MSKPVEEHALLRLEAEIRAEMENAARVVADAGRSVEMTADRPPSFLELRGMADLVHDFYTGIEKTFRRIAPELNGGIPAGDAWHRRLLDSMAMEIAEVRPAVIGRDTLRRLDEYLRFRHLFRNVYGFELEQDRVLELCRGMAGVWTVVEADLGRFMRFLRQLAAAGASTTRTVPRP